MKIELQLFSSKKQSIAVVAIKKIYLKHEIQGSVITLSV